MRCINAFIFIFEYIEKYSVTYKIDNDVFHKQ